MTIALLVDTLAPWQLLILQLIAALACFLLSMMAAQSAQVARVHGRPLAFSVFMLLTISFSLAMAWVLKI